MSRLINRAGPRPVALETTLLLHGVPRDEAPALARELVGIVRTHGASPAIVGLVEGRPTVGMTDDELAAMLAAPEIPKANSSNLGVLAHQRRSAATTVSATMELAAQAGVRIFATGGVGGIHADYASHLDISADLAALARWPLAVVASGVKSLLDVAATREVLESLGYQSSDSEPTPSAFYIEQPISRWMDPSMNLPTSPHSSGTNSPARGGVLVVQPVPEADAIDPAALDRWLSSPSIRGRCGRSCRHTAILAHLHRLSRGATLRANLALIRANTALAARIAAAW